MSEAAERVRNGDWTRSKNKKADQLHIYVTGELFDCSFRVGSSEFRVFKCHKVILATVSRVFEAMLYGSFVEATKDCEDPINMGNVDPDAFDTAMRYIYGDILVLKNADLAVQVYKFAHMMEITSLESAILHYFKEILDGQNVLLIYDTLMTLKTPEFTEEAEAHIVKVLQESISEEILSSQYWLKVSPCTVGAVLQLQVNVEELHLYEALARWGEAMLKKDPEASLLGMREKVQEFLPLIRFESMTPTQAAQLSLMTPNLLSDSEKHSILLCAVLKDLALLPTAFKVNDERPVRVRPKWVKVQYVKTGKNSIISAHVHHFEVTADLELVGFELPLDFTYIEPDFNVILVEPNSKECKFIQNKKCSFRVQDGATCPLLAGKKYIVKAWNKHRANLFLPSPQYNLFKPINSGLDIYHGIVPSPCTCLPVSKFHYR